MTLKTVPVTGTLYNADGSVVVGAIVSALLTVEDADGGVTVPSQITTTTNSSGVFTLNLWPNARGINGSQYRVRAQMPGALPGALLMNVLVRVPDGDPAIAVPIQNILNLITPPAFLYPGTVPSAGQVLMGNAGGTAYTPTTLAANKQLLFNDGGTPAGDAGLAYDKATGAITVGGKTVTASAPVLQGTQTWNNAGVTFTAALINVTDTQSAAGSKLVDWQVGGVSQFSIDKAGSALFGAPAGVPFGIGLDQTKFSRGIYAQSGANSVYLKAASTLVFGYQHGAGMVLSNNLPVGWSPAGSDASASPDLTLFRGGAGILEQRNGVNSQEFRAYGTYTDAANYERLCLRYSGGVFQLVSESAGTGVARPITFRAGGLTSWQIGTNGNLTAVADSTYDIGASGANRPRTGYFGTGVQIGSAKAILDVTAGGAGRLSLLRAADGFGWTVDVDSADTLRFLSGSPPSVGTVRATWTDTGHLSIVGTVKGGSFTVATLPSATTAGDGARAMVTDATQAFTSANIGSAPTGSGTNKVPVIAFGGAWVIG